MGCEFSIWADIRRQPDVPDLALRAFEMLAELEDQMSVFRPQSDISRLNRDAGQRDVPVEPGLYQILETSCRLSQLTGGAFDITAGPLIELWSGARRRGSLPDETAIRQARSGVGWNWLALDPSAGTIRFNRPHVRIDLGAIGKGYTLDRIDGMFRAAGLDHYLLHGGQSSVIARGPAAGGCAPRDEQGWTIGLTHPLVPGRRWAELTLANRAIGTAGSGRKDFYLRGRRYGHIVDPRSGLPPDHNWMATVIADDAATADALATACYVMTADEVRQVMDARRDLQAIILARGRTPGSLECHTFNGADQRLRTPQSGFAGPTNKSCT